MFKDNLYQKLTIAECRKTLGNESKNYSDEELIKIRDWLDNMADVVLEVIEKNGIEAINEIVDRQYKD